MRHGIILYAGREGSSAILAHLRRHPGVVVPLFEQLDTDVLEREVPRADWVHLALRRVRRGGRYAPEFFAPASAGLPRTRCGGAAGAAQVARLAARRRGRRRWRQRGRGFSC
ncbi:MAG: hypothetical protein K2X49_15070 [Acetobacteraceae bacterium]|nr:hypothetical protein [Acetobacteraceae bacterium]